MSLAPAIHPAIRGVEGKRRPVEKTCCAPGCISVSQQGHHMWSRSYLRGQPLDWVSLPSGRIVSNVVGVCMRHHADVTGGVGGHKSMIRLEPDETFIWLKAVPDGWMNEGLLHPQPWSETPVAPLGVTAHWDEDSPERTRRGDHAELAEGETCESCGYTKPVKRDPLPARKTKRYTMDVPEDTELGADVLDEWVEQFAVILGFEGDVTKRLVRYHVTVAVFAWAMQNRSAFVKDIMEMRLEA